jgi:hypothetical protein
LGQLHVRAGHAHHLEAIPGANPAMTLVAVKCLTLWKSLQAADSREEETFLKVFQVRIPKGVALYL